MSKQSNERFWAFNALIISLIPVTFILFYSSQSNNLLIIPGIFLLSLISILVCFQVYFYILFQKRTLEIEGKRGKNL